MPPAPPPPASSHPRPAGPPGRTHHGEVAGRAVVPTEVAALEHVGKLVAGAVEDVYHVGLRVAQASGTVPISVFGGQPGQVGQVEDVGVAEGRMPEAVDVAEGDGGEAGCRGWGSRVHHHQVRPGQVAPGQASCQVQKGSQRGEEGQCPEGSPQSMGAWATGPAQPMQSAGAGEGGQVPGGCCPLSSPQEALLIPCLLLLGFRILLCKFDFAHNLDRHLSPAAGTSRSLPAPVPPGPAAPGALRSGSAGSSGSSKLRANGEEDGDRVGARGGGVTPTPSSSAALVMPLPLPPLVSLLDRLLVASLISTSTAVSPCVCPCKRASERGSERCSATPCSPSRSAQHVLRSPPRA